MQKKIIIAGLLLTLTVGITQAQTPPPTVDTLNLFNDIFSKLQDKSSGGTIDLYQDPALHVLVQKNTRINKKEGIDGYRIQIFSSSGQEAREKALEIREKFLEMFPDFDPSLVYVEYVAPYFKLRVGDYRNKNEAYEFYHKLRKPFPSSYIVKSKINFPKLENENL